MTKTQAITKAFMTGYRFEEFYPGLINQTLPENGELSDVLTSLKAGADQHVLDIQHDRLKAIAKTRHSQEPPDLDIER